MVHILILVQQASSDILINVWLHHLKLFLILSGQLLSGSSSLLYVNFNNLIPNISISDYVNPPSLYPSSIHSVEYVEYVWDLNYTALVEVKT